MNITLSVDQFCPRCIYFGDPVLNTIMENSRFIKLIYSNELVIMNGLYFEIPLNISHKATYFRRNKYYFDMTNSYAQEIIKNAQDIEYAILKKYDDNRQSIFSRSSESGSIPVKNMKPMIFDSFQHGCIKSESGSEFYSEESQKEGGNINNNNNNNISISSTSSHPSYHLNIQRQMRHTFDIDESKMNSNEKTTSPEIKDLCVTYTSWHVILKVSGIWETMTEFGLTYKFIITPKYNES